VKPVEDSAQQELGLSTENTRTNIYFRKARKQKK
jgi:hypothetical protein